MRSTRRMIEAIERFLPGITRRQWGAIAVAAARRAQLPEAGVQALRRALEDEFALADGASPS